MPSDIIVNRSPHRGGREVSSSPSSEDHPHRTTGDLLRGAQEIAAFLLGDAGERRRVYRLAATGAIPTFRLGQTLCARRSVLLAWIAQQEASRHGAKTEALVGERSAAAARAAARSQPTG